MNKGNPNIIIIPKANDKLYGFLSNDSKYSFTLKDVYTEKYVYWPTVTHYIEAKKFEGTQYEDTIRNAKTVAQVRILSREREIRVTMGDDGNTGNNVNIINKQKIYGNKRIMQHLKTTWETDVESLLYIALNAKFTQHTSLRNALMSTAPRIIEGNVDKISDITAQIIMEIREGFMLGGGKGS